MGTESPVYIGHFRWWSPIGLLTLTWYWGCNCENFGIVFGGFSLEMKQIMVQKINKINKQKQNKSKSKTHTHTHTHKNTNTHTHTKEITKKQKQKQNETKSKTKKNQKTKNIQNLAFFFF